MNTDKRTDEELNRIIAGWAGTGSYVDEVGLIQLPMATDGQSWDFSPNYCRDLNAVHEAVMRLLNSKPGYWDRAWFWGLHQLVTGIDSHDGWGEVDARSCCDTSNATARQRAEALVRVIEESKK